MNSYRYLAENINRIKPFAVLPGLADLELLPLQRSFKCDEIYER
jgi:hypothetical protein